MATFRDTPGSLLSPSVAGVFEYKQMRQHTSHPFYMPHPSHIPHPPSHTPSRPHRSSSSSTRTASLPPAPSTTCQPCSSATWPQRHAQRPASGGGWGTRARTSWKVWQPARRVRAWCLGPRDGGGMRSTGGSRRCRRSQPAGLYSARTVCYAGSEV